LHSHVLEFIELTAKKSRFTFCKLFSVGGIPTDNLVTKIQ